MQLFVIGIIFILAGIGAMFARRRHLTQQNIPPAIPPLGILLGVVIGLAGTVVVVPAGHVGVPVLFGNVQQRTLEEGLRFKNPLAEVELMTVRTEVYTMSGTLREGQKVGDDSIKVLSKDGLEMPLDISVAYRLVPGDAPGIYQTIGPNYIEKIIRPAARTAIREAASNFTAQEAYSTKRTELADSAQQGMSRRIQELLARQELFDGQGFVIQQVMLRNVSLPSRLRAAIEEKLSAEQEAQRMEFVLDKERKEAERKKIEAQGIQDFQKIVSEGISEQLLRWKGIEATSEIARSSNAKVIVIGSGEGGLPVILNPDAK
jgi:regulator of protease activity HflC (stomatin/prohibitin superfamily)